MSDYKNIRQIVFDFDESKHDLTKDEKELINHNLNLKYLGFKLPCLVRISKKIHLDFIGWDNLEYNDVLICLTKRGTFKSLKGLRYLN